MKARHRDPEAVSPSPDESGPVGRQEVRLSWMRGKARKLRVASSSLSVGGKWVCVCSGGVE
jgi:hypothetical protein